MTEQENKKKPHVQTKLKLAMLAMLIAVLGFFAIYFLPTLEPVYSTLISAVLGILTIYSGGNIGSQFFAERNAKKVEAKTTEEKDDSGVKE
jgi:hypothetical protein